MHTELIARAQRLEGYVAQDPGNLALLRDLAGTYHEAGEQAAALATLDRAAGFASEAGGLNPLRGQVLLALGRWDEAATLFRQALEFEPQSAALLFNAGYAAWAAGSDPELSVQLLRRAAEQDPGNVRALYYAALASDAAGDADNARSFLEQALSIEPRYAEALGLLARLLLDAGETQQAAQLADRCVAANGAGAAGWQLKGEIALFSLDALAAGKHLQQALDLDPTDLDTRVSLAQAAMMLGRVRHARQLLEFVVERDATHAGAQSMLGWACAASEETAAARSAFAKAAAADPEAADPLAGLACIALAEGDTGGARQHCDRALALEPGNPLAGLLRARIDELGGQPERAQAAVRDILASTPFGAAAPSFGEMVSKTSRSRAGQRMQRRFARASRAKAGRS